MPPSPSIIPAKAPVHRKRRAVFGAPTATLTLVQAVYPTDTPGSMDLKFDRAIDIDAFDGTQVDLKDGIIENSEYLATGPAELVDAQTVRLFLVSIDDYFIPDQLLNATGATGIVALDDGGTWAGCTDLPLPFP